MIQFEIRVDQSTYLNMFFFLKSKTKKQWTNSHSFALARCSIAPIHDFLHVLCGCLLDIIID